ncbi:MAG: SIMPL domain-containing protein [Candidatus Lustribacter sp.]|jgi:uncharacterized protein YggE
MKHRILAAVAAFAVATGTGAAANAQTEKHLTPTLTVTGEASLTRAPDRADVTFRIETTNDQAATATSDNAAIADALGTKLAPLGIPAAAITTTGYGLTYTPRPPKPDPASTQRYGFTVERTIDVAVSKVNAAGAVVDAGVAAGVTGVNGVTFSLHDRGPAQRSAQAAALADAVAQAHALAAAAKVRLVRILAISPSGGVAQPLTLGAPRVMMSAAVPTTIDAGDLTVRAAVTVRYEIAP